MKCHFKAALFDNAPKAVNIREFCIYITKIIEGNGYLRDCKTSPVQQGEVFSGRFGVNVIRRRLILDNRLPQPLLFPSGSCRKL